MFSVNLIGNLGKDAQMVTGKSGRELTKLTLAVSGRESDKPYWFDVLMNYRPNLMPFLVKGQRLYVQGSASVSMGNGYLNLNVYADQVELLGSPQSSETQPAGIPSVVPKPGEQVAAPTAEPDPFA